MVFYRKYRPQKIEELDIAKVRERLTSILLSNDIPHAMLFTGPKGLGKTSTARILAKAINCEKKSNFLTSPTPPAGLHGAGKSQTARESGDIKNFDVEPCNECEVCLSITDGSNMDVIEIDAASNRGVDEIRTLRETIKFSPAALAYKVYIIDEVHMLTTEAFNALLKTLEEPPRHAVFILCTTEEWKLPQTIISRAFSLRFDKPVKEELARSVARILAGEELKLNEDVLFDTIYSLSDGSFRDAAKIIEELSFAAKDKKITKELLENLYNTNFIDLEIFKFISALVKKDIKEVLTILQVFSKKGSDFKIVTEKIIDYLRKVLLKKTGFANDIPDMEIDVFPLVCLVEYFEAAYRSIKNTPIASLPLELAAVKWCVIENSESIIHNSGLNDVKTVAGDGLAGQKVLKENREAKPDKETQTEEKAQNIVNPTLNSPKEKLFFDTLISEVKHDNHSVAGLLRGVKLVELSENEFKFEAPYKFHSDKLNDIKIRAIIEKRAGQILKKEMKMVIETGKK